MYIYIIIYMYMSWVPDFTATPPKGSVPQDGLPQRVEYACNACYTGICMHMHANACICIH